VAELGLKPRKKSVMEKEKNNNWTLEEDNLLRSLVLANATAFDIANKVNRTESAVKSRAHHLGITLARLGNRRRHSSKWGWRL
jgi:hypothetical protein